MSISECIFHGEQESYHCGYCEGKKKLSRHTHGATFTTLTVDDYQALMFRGWRRSGGYCYKPTMDKICCPQYTIRCQVGSYYLSRAHRRCLKRMDAFLRTGVRPAPRVVTKASAAAAARQANNSAALEPRGSASNVQGTGDYAAAAAAKGDLGNVRRGRMREGKARQKRWARRLAKLRALSDAPASGGFDAVMAAYEARRAARAARRNPRTLEQLLEAEGRPAPSGSSQPSKHRLRVVLLPSARREFDAATEHSLYARYQTAVHGDSPSECGLQQFRRFLCDSPLAYAKRGSSWLGSFHQQYWLEPEGRLIMVGVMDVLPDCTSSVYVFYDPEFAWLNLGTYAALTEIAHTRKLGLPLYCMGYYIHDCVKMRYKGAFAGSQLLCPETYTWHCLKTVCVPMLNAKDYCRFAPPSVPSVAPVVPPDDLQVALGRGSGASFMPYRRLCELMAGSQDKAIVEDIVRSFAFFVGPDCARRIRLRII